MTQQLQDRDGRSPSTGPRPPFRADHVGSLLRPPALLDARQRHERGEIDARQLRGAEDDAIRQAVALQEDIGLSGITDGEFRRAFFHVDFLCGFDGLGVRDDAAYVTFQGVKAAPQLSVTGPIAFAEPIMRADFSFLNSVTSRTAKVCMPAPGILHNRGDRASLRAQYPDDEQFFADLVAAYRAEVDSLYAAGCRYLQIDDTTAAMLCDPAERDAARQRGDDPDHLLELYARAVSDIVSGRPDDLVVSVHTCRGNFRSTWMAEGGYEPVAELAFNGMAVDAFFLEYDSDRAGGFEPLRFMPDDKRVVLGLVSSKVGALEDGDELMRRIDQAARYVPAENLCLSPQCGFASTVEGNQITPDDQRRKLELVVEVAERAWGSAQ